MRSLAALVSTAALLAVSCQAQEVTATKRVSSGRNTTELLRKINGRWWTQDNREVHPPGPGEVFWVIDSKPGVVTFYHHRPFDLSKAELLHLFLKPPEVEALLGQPNRAFGEDAHAMWTYYARDGTRVWVRFMDGVLGEAEYQPVGEKSYAVAVIAQELGGRSIYKVMAERATKKSDEWLAQRMEESRRDQEQRAAALRASMPTPRGRSSAGMASPTGVARANPATTIPALPVANQPEALHHVVSHDALAAIKVGATRGEVVAQLGEPSWRTALNMGDETRETLTYHLPDQSRAEIRLVDGKVTKVPF